MVKGRFRHFVNIADRPLDQDEIDGNESRSRKDWRPDEREKTATKRKKNKNGAVVRARISYFSRIVEYSRGKMTRINTERRKIEQQQQETKKDDPHALIS